MLDYKKLKPSSVPQGFFIVDKRVFIDSSLSYSFQFVVSEIQMNFES